MAKAVLVVVVSSVVGALTGSVVLGIPLLTGLIAPMV
jgi:hypothetical protein